MAGTMKAVRGTRDLLPPETELWARVERVARGVFARYGFGEIRTPVFEATELFARGVGEETDIVSKEMFTWEDGGRPNITLLKEKWIERRRELSVENPPYGIGLIQPVPQQFLVTQLEGLRTYVEFRVLPPVKVDVDLRRRHEYVVSLGLKHLVVVPRETIDRLDQTSYQSLSISLEDVAGRFVTNTQLLSLRPENTVGVVRACIEYKLAETGGLQKLFYIGPQFRRERPQRGRYRQFWQIGAEVLGPVSSGAESAIRDAEVLEMLASLLDELGVKGWRLALNSVGSAADRPRYVAALRKALEPVKAGLCVDCQRRAETNPLRVLDCKVPEDQAAIDALPKIAEFLDAESTAHFAAVREALDACGVGYVVEPRLVRGLDYYTRTTFEFTVPDGGGLGTQNALLGGGRYDGLSEMLGGPKAPGIGFAIGEDRLILTLQAQAGLNNLLRKTVDIYLAPLGKEQNPYALAVAKYLRNFQRPVLRSKGFSVEVGDGSFRLKKSFDAAEKASRFVGILGEQERANNSIKLKDFANGEQVELSLQKLAERLSENDQGLKGLVEGFWNSWHTALEPSLTDLEAGS